jgi:RNA polymerase Rpb1, domain 5
LNEREFWFHASSGRDGIISTGISTADVGYLTRSMAKSLEDIKLNALGNVVTGNISNSNGQIVAFDFGKDTTQNLDTCKCIKANGLYQFCDVNSLWNQIKSEKYVDKLDEMRIEKERMMEMEKKEKKESKKEIKKETKKRKKKIIQNYDGDFA